MCANTSKHRVGRSRTGDPAYPGVWASKVVDGGTSAGPRHAAAKATAGYSRYVGRVGALAVSLGVGMAVAASPGVAYADTDADSDSTATASESGIGAGPSASSGGAATGVATSSGATETDTAPSTSSSTSPTSSTTSTGTDAPTMNVASSGGAHTSTYGPNGTGDAAGTSALDAPAAGSEPTDPEDAPSVDAPIVEDPIVDDPVGESPEPPAVEVDAPIIVPDPPAADENIDAGGTGSDHSAPSAATSDAVHTAARPAAADDVSMASTTEPEEAPSTFGATTFSSLVVPPPPADPLSALLAVPGAVVNMFTGFVGSLLAPFLVPGPAAPVAMPGLWAVLAWVRREIEHTFFNRSPVAVPIQTGQSLTGVVTGNLNAVDPNGDPLTATVTQQGQFGTVVINPNGTYTYTPNAAVPAGGIVDSFKVTISDGPEMHLPGIFGLVQGVLECFSRFIGIAQPDTIVKTVAVTVVGSAIGVAPVVSTSVVGPIVTPNEPPVVLDSGILVTDVDSPKLSNATVKISVGYVQGDVLAFTQITGNPITGTFDPTTGTLTLSGEATVAQYQQALRAVTFASTAATLVGAKAVLVTVTDTQNLSSLPALVAVAMLGANVPPLVVTVPVGPIVTAGNPPVALNPLLTVVDLNSPRLSGATVTITTGLAAGRDVLMLGPLTNNPITAVFNASTGTLTLSGEATVAQYQDALRAVRFASTSDAVVGLRTVSIIATDTSGAPSLPGLVAVTVLGLPSSVPSVVATTPVKVYTGGGSPVVLDASIRIVDADSTTATGATITFDPLTYSAQTDRLAFLDANGIQGNWDSQTGTLRLTGAATIDAYQAALRTVTFASDATVGEKILSIVLTADGTPSVPGVVAVTVVDLPILGSVPSVVVATPVKLYTAGSAASVLSPAVTIVDVDSDTITKAVVSIGGYDLGADRLTFIDANGITGAWNAATGTLVLTGNGSLAAYETALESVTFSSTSTALVGVRTVSIVVTADDVASAPGLVAITVTPAVVNVPSIITTAPVKLYTAGSGASVLSPVVTIIDVDSGTVTGATVTIGAGYDAGTDSLALTPVNDITGVWNSVTGTLTLQGSGSIAEYEAALKAVTFTSTSAALVGVRAASIVVTADGVSSAPGLVAIVVNALSVSVPSIVTTTPVKLYTAGSGPSALSPVVTIIDVDSGTVTGATVSIGVGYDPGTDSLAFVNANGITGSWDSATGVLTLTGERSLPAYQDALRTVTFTSTSTALVGVRTALIVVTADGVSSAPGLVAITVTPATVNVPSIVVTTPVKLYGAGSGASPLDSAVTIVDLDSGTVTKATVTLGVGYDPGTDSLAFANANGITGSWNSTTGVLTLSGEKPLADYQAALRTVTFTSTSTALIGVRTASIVVTANGVDSAPGLVAITVTPAVINVPSIVTTSPVKLYTAGSGASVLSPVVTIIDVDSGTVTGATVTIGAGYDAGIDSLALTPVNAVTGTWNSLNGTLTLQGSGTLAEYEAALKAVTFTSTSTALIGVRTASIVVTANGVDSAPGLVAITVTPAAVNVPSIVVTTPVKLYTAGSGASVLSPVVTIIDLDSTTVTGATVTIGGLGYGPTTDSLGFVDANGITGDWDSSTGVLTLTGSKSVADYEAALKSVTFTSTATALVGVRTASIIVTANGVASAAGLVAITVTALPINVPPVITTSIVNLGYSIGNLPKVLSPTLTIIDDSGSIKSAKISIDALSRTAGDVLSWTPPGHGLITSVGYDASTGTLTLTGAATAEQYQEALRSVTFSSTDVGLIARTVSFSVVDAGDAPSASLPVLLTVLPNARPLVVSSLVGVDINLVNSDPAKVLDPNIAILDDSPKLTGASVTITYVGVSIGGNDVLAATPPIGSGITWSYAPATRTLTMSGEATVAQYQEALRSVTFDTSGGILGLGVRTVTFAVTDKLGLTSIGVPLTVPVISVLGG